MEVRSSIMMTFFVPCLRDDVKVEKKRLLCLLRIELVSRDGEFLCHCVAKIHEII